MIIILNMFFYSFLTTSQCSDGMTISLDYIRKVSFPIDFVPVFFSSPIAVGTTRDDIARVM